ncbi:aromatic ring-hydroxylating oxygenase subunit alpha [Sphingopyxis sp. Root1497]|uniref:aromatic ring-hydroxylating oxygenase subunit alpha n=1 Tax=Sphingopyxis sp. Root1497 TaxID=1736474 RepID=UPI0006FFE2B8|nr:Rieske (2Fe-2S) protein [Sphingopyxis sp. Root1497]
MSLTLPAAPLEDAALSGNFEGGADLYERELKQIFARFWMPVGRAEELAEVGGYFTWDRTRIPTVMVRSVDQRIRGYYNSCRHRGAPVVRTPTGRARAFRCQYHSWTYDTFGKLMAIPDERDFGNIDRCAHSLVPLRLAELGGWLWIDQSGEAPDLEGALGALHPWIEARTHYRLAGRRTRVVDANWKRVVAHLGARVAGAQAHFPNVCFVEAGGELSMMAAWPRDEQTTEVELVLCAAPDAAEPSSDALDQRLDEMLAAFAPGRAAAEGALSGDFAGAWSRALAPEA